MKWLAMIMVVFLSACSVPKDKWVNSSNRETPLWIQKALEQKKEKPTSSLLNSSEKMVKKNKLRSDLAYDFPAPKNEMKTDARGDKTQLSLSDEKMSPLEKLYNKTGLTAGRNIRQWGYDAFSRTVPSETAGLVNSNYLLGPGDELLIHAWGSFSVNKSVVIDKEGRIFLDSIGQISLAAVPVHSAESVITEVISRQYKDFSLSVSLGRLHAIRVMVSGQVANPGLHHVPANASLIDVLAASGGIKKEGTLRNVQWLRSGRSAVSVDLYEVLQGKTLQGDDVILAGDSIVVGTIGKTAAVMSPTLEGIIELNEKTTLLEATALVKGITAFTREDIILLERQLPSGGRKLEVVESSENATSFILRDSDIVSLPASHTLLKNAITIEGAVLHEGTYPHTKGMKISDALKLSQGFLLNASLDKALVVRKLGTPQRYDIQPYDNRGIQRTELLWVNLAEVLSGNEKTDIELSPLDTVRIFWKKERQQAPRVRILGAVTEPREYTMSAGMTLGDLISLAGGVTADAFSGTASIVRRVHAKDGHHLDVEVIPFRLDEVLQNKEVAKTQLCNLDQIIIRRVQSLQVSVSIEGRVQFPGTYILRDGSRIVDLVVAAGGLLNEADVRAAMFTRESVRQWQQQSIDEMFSKTTERFERTRNVVTRDGNANESVANTLSLLGLPTSRSISERFQVLGRVVLDMTRADFLSSSDNLTLESGDRLVIPRLRNTVTVLGRVFSPNAFVWHEGMSVNDYVKKAGGLKEDADPRNLYVVLASGEVHSVAQGRFARALGQYRPRAGDAILIPMRPVGRSRLAKTHDIITLLRACAETGLIGTSIPQVKNADSSIGIDLGNTETSTPESSTKVYDKMLRP